MKTAERIALLYAGALAAAGAVSYYRGRRSAELFTDVALHGLIAGTGINVVAWLALEDEATAGPVEQALTNGDWAKLSEAGRKVLEQVQAHKLYEPFRQGGVKVAAVPPDPSIVRQDET